MISHILLSWGVELYCYIWGNAGPLLQLLQLDCLIYPSCHYNCFISSCVFPLTVLIANFFCFFSYFSFAKFTVKKKTSVGQDVTFLPRYHFHMVKTLVISSMKNDRFVMSNKKWQRGGTDSTNPLDVLKDKNLNSGAFSFSFWHYSFPTLMCTVEIVKGEKFLSSDEHLYFQRVSHIVVISVFLKATGWIPSDF